MQSRNWAWADRNRACDEVRCSSSEARRDCSWEIEDTGRVEMSIVFCDWEGALAGVVDMMGGKRSE